MTSGSDRFGDILKIVSLIGGAMVGMGPAFAHFRGILTFESAAVIQLGLLVMTTVMIHGEVALDG